MNGKDTWLESKVRSSFFDTVFTTPIYIVIITDFKYLLEEFFTFDESALQLKDITVVDKLPCSK